MSKGVKDTTNPLNEGVTYAEFLANVKGTATEKSLLDKLNLDKPTREWLETELNQFKNK